MKVSVVVPAYNEEKYLAGCLKALTTQKDPPDEILVIDNNSTDQTAVIARSFPGVQVISEKHQGMTPARNCGFNAAQYDIIARTDADTVVPKDWIKQIKKRFLAQPDLLALSGPAHFYGVPKIFQYDNWPTRLALGSVRTTMKHDGLFGPNMAIRKSAWEMVKNEICVNDKDVHEDMDLAIHIASHGNVLFDDDLVVSSSPRRWKTIEPYFEYTYRYVKTIEKHKQWLKRFKKATSVKTMIKKTKTTTRKLMRTARKTFKRPLL
jgi:glycosyltransferase involved in cell wall biosynthesis